MTDDSKILWTKVEGVQPLSSTPYSSQIVRNYILPNGKPKKAYISNKRDFVVGLPITRKDEVILVREFRPGLERIMLDLPSGSLIEGEEPMVGMERELLEETGYRGIVEFVNRSPTAPFSTQHRNTFLIRDCEKVQEPQLDHDEFLEVVVMPLKEFYYDWVIKGKTTNAIATIYAMNELGIIQANF